MNSLEYISSCTAIAGIAFLLTMWHPTHYQPYFIGPDTEAVCPDLQIRHGVGSDLKTKIKVVDACSAHLNIIKPWRVTND